jgi:hypothetical protein
MSAKAAGGSAANILFLIFSPEGRPCPDVTPFAPKAPLRSENMALLAVWIIRPKREPLSLKKYRIGQEHRHMSNIVQLEHYSSVLVNEYGSYTAWGPIHKWRPIRSKRPRRFYRSKAGSTAGNKDATGGNLTISVYQSANFSSERYHRG